MITFAPTYEGGSAGAMRLAEVLRTDSRRLDTQLGDLVADYLPNCEPILEPEMSDASDLLVCPVAHALARASGYELSGLILLMRLHCPIDVNDVENGALFQLQHGILDDLVHHDALLGRGLLWRSPRRAGRPATVTVDSWRCGLPDTVGSALEGRLLHDLVSHTLIDPLGLRIREVRMLGRGDRHWSLVLDGAPAAIALEEAVYG